MGLMDDWEIDDSESACWLLDLCCFSLILIHSIFILHLKLFIHHH